MSGKARGMGGYGDCQVCEVDASPEACYSALADVERLGEWQGALRSAEVLERDAQGRPSVIEFVVDAKLRTVRYRLRQVHDPPHRLGSEYLGGDFRDFSGEWRFVPLDGGRRTRVELELNIDPGRFVPGPVRTAIRDAVMRRALRDLRTRVEGTPATASRG